MTHDWVAELGFWNSYTANNALVPMGEKWMDEEQGKEECGSKLMCWMSCPKVSYWVGWLFGETWLSHTLISKLHVFVWGKKKENERKKRKNETIFPKAMCKHTVWAQVGGVEFGLGGQYLENCGRRSLWSKMIKKKLMDFIDHNIYRFSNKLLA